MSDLFAPEIIDLANALESLLSEHHRGSADGLTSRQLAQRFSTEQMHCSERDVRLAVTHLRLQGKPVGATALVMMILLVAFVARRRMKNEA